MTHYEEIVEAREKGYEQGKCEASGCYWLGLFCGAAVGGLLAYFFMR